MKILFLALTLSTAAMASEVVVIQESASFCNNETPGLEKKAQIKAEAKCLLITGYPNAKMIGTPVYESRISGWGTGVGCSVIKFASIKASFECLIGNK